MEAKRAAVATLGLLVLAIGTPLAATGEPAAAIVPAARQVGAESHAWREFRVQEDRSTGRLVRRAVTLRQGSQRGGVPAMGRPAVQGGFGGSSASHLDLDALVRDAAQRYGVDAGLIRAVIRQESAFDPFAVSRKGAKGLMQLMPGTAKQLGVADVFDPAENVRGGTQFLRRLIDRYDGDLRLALAAYNAGEGAVDRHKGVPPFSETKDYVNRIVGPPLIVGGGVNESGNEPTEPQRQRVVAFEGPSGELRFETR